MRMTLFAVLGLLLAAVLVALLWVPSVRMTVAPGAPQPTFRASLAPNREGDTSFVLKTLTDGEARLLWADAYGLHEVEMTRKDFDLMFGTVKVEPLTPEEQGRP